MKSYPSRKNVINRRTYHTHFSFLGQSKLPTSNSFQSFNVRNPAMFRITNLSNGKRGNRRAAVLVLAAVFMIVMFALLAFSIDLGYIVLAKTQLQAAADAAALAAASSMGDREALVTNAQDIGKKNHVGGSEVKIQSADVVVGTWDPSQVNPSNRFAPLADQSQPSNAVKVTARADGTTDETPSVPLFFAAVLNKRSANITAEAVATTNPRDICFVVDLSSSMNDDSDPYGSPFYQDLVQALYNDFGFGTYPGTQQSIGYSFSGVSTLNGLTSTSSSPLLTTKPNPVTLRNGQSYTIPSQYRFTSSTSSSTRTKRAYSWVMDEQLAGKSGQASLPGIMPAAVPVPNSGNTTNYNYWKSFIDSYASELGYKRYVYYMMTKGRDQKVSSIYTPWAVGAAGDPNPNCVRNIDPVPIPGVSLVLNFPAREQPTHSCRRSAIAAIQEIWNRNANTPVSLRDHISIITFDTQAGTSSTPVHSLDDNYETAMHKCADLQATGVSGVCTATGYGLRKAIEYLDSQGRINANKVVVLLTDGMPNIYVPDPNHPLPLPEEYSQLGYGNDSKDSAILEGSVIQGKQWQFYPVGLGLDCDDGFMSRLYSVSSGQNDPSLVNPYTGGSDPYQMETKLRDVFHQILSHPKMRLVQ
jgi:Flp pilus assembly protein TadG